MHRIPRRRSAACRLQLGRISRWTGQVVNARLKPSPCCCTSIELYITPDRSGRSSRASCEEKTASPLTTRSTYISPDDLMISRWKALRMYELKDSRGAFSYGHQSFCMGPDRDPRLGGFMHAYTGCAAEHWTGLQSSRFVRRSNTIVMIDLRVKDTVLSKLYASNYNSSDFTITSRRSRIYRTMTRRSNRPPDTAQ